LSNPTNFLQPSEFLFLSSNSKEEPEAADRRKLLGQVIPFTLNAFWEARSTLSPARLTAETLSQFSELESNLGNPQRVELETTLKDILRTNFHIERDGLLALTLSREELLVLIERILIRKFASEGAKTVHLDILSHGKRADAVFRLPTRDISVKLYFSADDTAHLQSDLDSAKGSNPSELLIFSWLPEVQERNLRFEPVFLSESRILKGGFSIQKITSIFEKITEDRFSARIDEWDQKSGKTKFLLSPNPELKYSQPGPRSA